MVDKAVNIGLLGLGTVGIGVYKILQNFPEVKIKKIAEKNLDLKRDINVDKSIMTTDIMEVVNDPEIQIVVEVIGGTDPAYDAIVQSINAGKHVVTANKELIAKRGPEIFDLANKKNVSVLYEASVGGGIPLIMPLKQSLVSNKITCIAGILNGTTNYILSRMEEERAEFKDVLAEAQKMGYAEADPTSDVEGYDAAYKIAILASIAYGVKIDVNKIYREGISKITLVDIDYAAELGYKIKLIAMAKQEDNGKIDVRVHPMLVPTGHPLAHINGVTNAVSVVGDAVGEVNFVGPGAGQMAAASAVVADLLSVVNEMGFTANILPSMRCKHTTDGDIIPIEETYNSYYVRFQSSDKPGVIGNMGHSCGKYGVSLLGVIQKDMLEGGVARIILLTHEVTESAIQAALREIEKHDTTKLIANVIRVFK
jgi:homoserine dehydrogenase